MKLLLMIVLFTFKSTIIMASCPEDQEPSFCQSHDTIPQLYCDDVDLQDEWDCKKRSYAKCVCKAGLFRKKDRKCVPRDQCDRAEKSENQPAELPPQTPPPYPYIIPEQLKGSEGYVEKVLTFVRSNQTMFLLMANKEEWPHILKVYWVCLTSTFIKFTASGAVRIMTRYKDVEFIGSHLSMVLKQGEAVFEVIVQYGRLELAINLDQNGTATGSNKYDFQDEFIVLDIGENCLLISYGSWKSRGPNCMLWGFDTQNAKTTTCHATMLNICSTDMVELWAEGGSCRVTDAQTNEETPTDPNQDMESKLRLRRNKPVNTDDVLKFLHNRENIHLQMMNEGDWLTNDCECITSAFDAVNNEGSRRSLECYIYTEILILSNITKKTIALPKMTKINQSVQFEVKDLGGVKSLALKTIIDGVPAKHPPKFISGNYVLEEANTDCLLLSYGPPSNGRQNCMLWGLSRQSVDEKTRCYKEVKSLCSEDIYDLTETKNICDQFDLEERIVDKSD
ncbi:uncharacterized protein [Dermacentor albipictus]|uniref:uncharacterized protein isoform X2 n=1 Tax=Dermacentor albipictus TaxID=60249 RepID=UPI0031FDD6EA